MGDAIKKLAIPIGATMIGGPAWGAAAAAGQAGAKGAKKIISPPEAPKAKVAPTPDEEAARIAKERLAQKRYAKAGRAGTMLTDDSKLG